MRRHKLILSFFIITFGWLTLALTNVNASANQSDPVSLLQYAADNMIAGLKSNKATLKTKPQIVYNLAYRFVVPYADLNAMSKRVLPPQIWNQATASEREQFVKEFTKTLIRTYASALSSYEDQSIHFNPIRGSYAGASTVEVSSEISSSQGQPIHVSYRLVRAGSTWKLLDLSVEGVDMLESFRAQFADILASGSMNQLLTRMSNHNNRS